MIRFQTLGYKHIHLISLTESPALYYVLPIPGVNRFGGDMFILK
ncbi:hypothetical protein M23134_02584 [Microscilla marina ATCC 23134]|uniref:Uncharacterized protein n=1 Tax=Microscilla marina ATCC 23134 TaxID=313606 RepID=A1ZNN8_MICM2|nr:hypothetical protein M23134_02584 [Microscilla marina ATCC 23134]